MNIVLCGMMGSGKTTVGIRISELTGMRWYDTDDLVTERHGKISDIFAGSGITQQYFDDTEYGDLAVNGINVGFAYRDPAFSRYEEGDLHQVPSAVTYDGTIKWWFQHVMGSGANAVADQAQLDAWAQDARVQAMPCYPNGDYCAILDGTAVVRIS